jgi:hypothetical protein
MTMGSLRARIAALSGVLFFACFATIASDKVQELQTRFDRETDPVHKAKILEKLGDAEFAEGRRAEKAGDYNGLGLLMEKYRDNARIAFDGLKKRRQDAERHPEGFKQLQFHVDKALRELDQILVIAPTEYKPPLLLVHQDLNAINDELLRMLFPHRPGEQPLKRPGVEKEP